MRFPFGAVTDFLLLYSLTIFITTVIVRNMLWHIWFCCNIIYYNSRKSTERKCIHDNQKI